MSQSGFEHFLTLWDKKVFWTHFVLAPDLKSVISMWNPNSFSGEWFLSRGTGSHSENLSFALFMGSVHPIKKKTVECLQI